MIFSRLSFLNAASALALLLAGDAAIRGVHAHGGHGGGEQLPEGEFRATPVITIEGHGGFETNLDGKPEHYAIDGQFGYVFEWGLPNNGSFAIEATLGPSAVYGEAEHFYGVVHAHGDDHDDHGHDDHDEHEDHDDHDDHDDHGDHDGHAHGEHDPHAWLSIENAQTWLNLVAGKLSAADPDNAGVYFANAAAAREEINDLVKEVNSILEPVRGRNFVVFHDAYQYFETSFDFPAAGAISLGDATDPSAARIAEIQDRVKDEGINCVLSEPQFNANLVATVLSGTDAKTGVIDPLGLGLEPGPKLYGDLIRNMGKALAGCL